MMTRNDDVKHLRDGLAELQHLLLGTAPDSRDRTMISGTINCIESFFRYYLIRPPTNPSGNQLVHPTKTEPEK